MAKVTETRVKISLTDAMSGPLRKIEGEATATSKAVTNLSSSLKNYASIGAQMAAGAFGFSALSDSIGQLVSSGLQFNKAMETNAVGMAGILTSMTTINGKNMEWNQALKASQGIIKGLNEDALKTAATSEELVGTFRALLGPGLGAGMKIDEIQKLTTTGVNAVKSLGLSGPQLIQELRDLVQGGITPASSTLATALGLTDADIKAAKASSEGLFNFLMERLKGFERAAQETPKTIAGMEDQLKEGFSKAMSIAVKPVQEKYKELMQQTSGLLFTDNLGINEDLTNKLQAAGQHVANMVEDFKSMGEIVAPVVVPAVEGLGTVLGIVLDNAGKITLAFAAWKAYDFTKNFNSSHFTQYAANAQKACQTEISAAQRAAQAVMQEENKKQTAIRQREVVEKAVTKTAKDGYIQLAAQLKSLSTKYQQMGLSAEEAGKLQYQAARQAARGNIELSQQIITAQTQHLEAANAANKQSGKLAKLTEWAGYTGVALTAVGIVLQSVTGDTNSWAYSTGQYLTMAGMAIEGVSMMITALSKLRDAYKEVALAKAVAGMLSVGGAAVAIGAIVGVAGAGVYALTHDISWDEAKRRYFNNPNAPKTDDKKKPADKPLDNTMPDIGSIQPKDFGGDTGKGNRSKGTSAAARQAERAAQKLQKELGNVHDLQAELNRKILEDTAEASTVAAAKLDEELTKMKSKLENAAKAGVPNEEIQKAQRLMDVYAEAEKRLANNDQTIKAHQQRMDMIQAEQDAHQLTAQQADNLRREELTSYQDKLQEILSSQQLNTEQRLQIMQEYSNAVKDMENATASDYKTAWEDALDYIRNKTYDQRATIQSGIDDILDSFTNFGQNMLTESKSIGERFDDLFKSLASSILNTMMKVIMQGLVMNSIMGMFGMGGGSSAGSIGGVKLYTDMSGWSPVSFHAKGGRAEGWAIVGEKGPELVDFSQPGRVYTAEQTAKALNGSNSLNNVKVVIENKTGQQVKATQANVNVDIKGYIINVVLEAVATNDGGINNILKGAMA